jgi:hypothetical protein
MEHLSAKVKQFVPAVDATSNAKYILKMNSTEVCLKT